MIVHFENVGLLPECQRRAKEESGEVTRGFFPLPLILLRLSIPSPCDASAGFEIVISPGKHRCARATKKTTTRSEDVPPDLFLQARGSNSRFKNNDGGENSQFQKIIQWSSSRPFFVEVVDATLDSKSKFSPSSLPRHWIPSPCEVSAGFEIMISPCKHGCARAIEKKNDVAIRGCYPRPFFKPVEATLDSKTMTAERILNLHYSDPFRSE